MQNLHVGNERFLEAPDVHAPSSFGSEGTNAAGIGGQPRGGDRDPSARGVRANPIDFVSTSVFRTIEAQDLVSIWPELNSMEVQWQLEGRSKNVKKKQSVAKSAR